MKLEDASDPAASAITDESVSRRSATGNQPRPRKERSTRCSLAKFTWNLLTYRRQNTRYQKPSWALCVTARVHLLGKRDELRLVPLVSEEQSIFQPLDFR